MENRPVLYSIWASIVIHAVLIALFLVMRIFASPPAAEAPPERLIAVKKVELPAEPLPQRDKITQDSAAEKENPVGEQALLPVMDKKELQFSEKLVSASQDKFTKPVPATISTELLNFDGREEKQTIIPPVNQKEVGKGPLMVNIPVTDSAVSVPVQTKDGEEINEEFLEKMPGFTPEPVMGLVDSNRVSTSTGETDVAGISRTTDYQDLKDMLSFDLSTYQDPRDNQKYFKISLRVNDKTKNFPTIPKEILFLLDASISIDQNRLDQFKTGLEDSLAHLNPDDLFNVAVFKETTQLFSPNAVPATAENLQKVKSFLGWIKAGEKTDAFGALKELIGTMNRSPSYIIFLSDGWPTQGMTDSRQLLNEISQVNNGKTVIFAYSGGAVNRYLLDFIAFKNRGWSEYSERPQFIGRNLTAFYDKIKDPIMLNMRYRMSGVLDENVFPKSLPDFFRNAEFTLYGTYNDEKELVLQLLGDAGGQTREFLARVPMFRAVAGNKDIARYWAFNKIYYLISQLKFGQDNTPVLKEIETLSNKFGIKTPYSNELKK